jgi:hypothetical protein
MTTTARTDPNASADAARSKIARFFSFPNPVNELAARTVAGGVFALTVLTLTLALTLGTGWLWLSAPLAYGFIARALTGPRFSPLGLLATRVIAPRLGAPRPVPGPPKRFAQSIGALFTTSAVVLVAFGDYLPAGILLAMIVVFSGLESFAGFCVGCLVFNWLIRIGLIPERVCEECANISLRVGTRDGLPSAAASG